MHSCVRPHQFYLRVLDKLAARFVFRVWKPRDVDLAVGADCFVLRGVAGVSAQ